ncbi:MAG TPA: GAF domain-containing protein, partial [Polyangiaceae bacterium]|nr:GAF domain-containing protein [Polyangiaceae bacterium]
DADKAATHWRIGRRLLAAERDAEHPEDVFAITNHLNIGRALMSELSERESLAKLNRKAGAKALAATAFAVAARYHEAGVSCLTRAEWAERPELRFALFSERVGSVLMAGERERAAALSRDLLELAPTRAARAAVHLIQSQVMMYQGKMLEAIASVRAGLHTLDIDFPADPATIDQGIGAGIGKMQAHLARVPIEELATLPEVADAEKLVAMQLLFHVIGPAIMTYPPLFVLAELITFDLALTYGTTSVCAKNFVDCGMIQGSALGDYAAAYRLGKVAFRVVERYDARALAGQVHFVFAAYVSPWGAPYAEALRSFEEARRLETDAGDHNHLGFSEALHLRILLLLGRHLEECAAASDDALALIDRIQAMVAGDGVRLCSHAIDQLRQVTQLTPKEARLSAPITRGVLASGNAQYAFQHGQLQMVVHALLDDWEGASEFWDFARERELAASTLLIVPEYCLFGCLIITQYRWARAPEAERPALLAELERGVDRLRGWAEGCPENFAHKHLLAAAELARVRGEPAEAVTQLFDRAIEAMGQQFLHLCALAHELLGRYWLGLGQKRVGEPLLREALQLYANWGALAKVRRLEAELDSSRRRARDARGVLLGSVRPGPGALEYNRSIDLGSVLKAQRAISGEVKSDRLYAALMEAILENAAAEHGCLVLCDDAEGLHVRARADQRGGDREVAVNHPLDDEPRACHQIIRYVARSLDPLVLDDASAHEVFGADPYIVRHRVKSVLCMPIINLGRLVAVLYVENDATTFAFSADRVETLRLIAGQAAISITNASLYESLERKVEERTRELAAKTRKMTAMLDSIEQAVFTLDDELRVQPEHSRYLESFSGLREVTGRGVSELLFAGSDRSDAEIATNESALRFSFGAPLVIARLNADHLIRAYTRPGLDGTPHHYEVDWSWITGEDGKVERVLVAARDVTRVRGLEQAAAEAAREKEMLAQLLDAGVEDFKSFAETARHLLEQHIAAALRGLSP